METTNKLQALTNALREAANNFKTPYTGKWAVIINNSTNFTMMPDGTQLLTMALYYTQGFLDTLNIHEDAGEDAEEETYNKFQETLLQTIRDTFPDYQEAVIKGGYQFTSPHGKYNLIQIQQSDWGWILIAIMGD